MTDADRLKLYAAMTETSRKWVTQMDTKAAFVSALNTATLAFVWSNAKLSDTQGVTFCLAVVASLLALSSLFFAVRVILPRTRIQQAFSQDTEYTEGYAPISYFGYVAKHYPPNKQDKYFDVVSAMDEAAFAQEALEQHFTISHIANKKASDLTKSGWMWMTSTLLITSALVLKG